MKALTDLLERLRGLATPATVTEAAPLPTPQASPPPRPQASASRVPLDLDDAAYVQDPYPTLATLRRHDPVHRSVSGAWLLTRYDDVLAALGDARFGNAPSSRAVLHERNRDRYVCADVAQNILPFLDPPAHPEQRRLVGTTFRAHLRQSAPDFDALARELLEPLRSREEFELITEFATPLAARVLGRFLGVPAEDEPALLELSEWFFYLFTAFPSEEIRVRVDEALAEFRTCFSELVERKRQSPGPDWISRCLATAPSIPPQVLVDTCMLLFADGVENVDKALASSLWCLSQNPDHLRLLRADPARLPRAVHECLRFESPAQYVGRVAREDIVLHGRLIRRQSGVLLMLGSANRDETRFDHADRFDPERDPNPHLAFGKARHSCIGAGLVHSELVHALGALLTLWPDLHVPNQELCWRPRRGHRWLERLIVRRA